MTDAFGWFNLMHACCRKWFKLLSPLPELLEHRSWSNPGQHQRANLVGPPSLTLHALAYSTPQLGVQENGCSFFNQYHPGGVLNSVLALIDQLIVINKQIQTTKNYSLLVLRGKALSGRTNKYVFSNSVTGKRPWIPLATVLFVSVASLSW